MSPVSTKKALSDYPWITILLLLLAVVVIGVGGVVVIAGNMTYHDWLAELKWFGFAVAASGVGKGLMKFGQDK